ncbi:MAG: hypothetical protein Athens101428_460 [Candidatus Berkelbacteria bacterium Athens1014_28]|uniref:Uncharacterized protein n=1 Tax=Candidatus Berkelbacteria bacterium Athens1014_28 TaxID=2017145 RepID=A0A554LM74_9BACT|nr:MAG: hypothetical protein Athens101428_460 [Candidatus Berkelbacteria bacterium Athens1014_28]
MLTGMAKGKTPTPLSVTHCGMAVQALGISDRAICPKCRRVLVLIRGPTGDIIGCSGEIKELAKASNPKGGRTDGLAAK